MAARAEAAAQPREILVTDAVRRRAGAGIDGPGRSYSLKGFDTEVTLYAAGSG